MNFPSIDIQGSILSSDLFGKIRSEQANFQQGKDFNQAFTNAKLKDEISLAWQDAKGQWTIFQNKLKRISEGESAATVTRSFWILPLLSNLGYDFQYLKSAEELNGKSFWINNRDNNIGGFPLFIAGYNESLDRRPENKTLRVSPHALIQEYLNYSEHLYGLVTNGKLLRLLRDASRLTRLSYLEFNLEKIMEEDLYSDFVILYRLLHVSRMPQKQDCGAESIIEKYHQEGLEAGATIRSKLGDAVKESIKALANGFVNHPDNNELRKAITEGKIEPDEFYRQQLRIIYRLLFLFVIEERNLVYSESKDPDNRRFSKIYYTHFSLQRLRKTAKRLPPPEASRHWDLWMGLINTFALFENQHTGSKMGIMALQGDLFGYHAISSPAYDLHDCRLSNEILLQIIKSLGYFENEKKLLITVNYGGLDVEEFGSVYEGLLELKLRIEPIPGSEFYSCSFDKSSERSSSGSHYTPEELVQPLIKHSLDYIIEERLKVPSNVVAIEAKHSIQAKQLLSIRVCDVACGSGHILLSAARKIALALARVETGEEQPNPKAVRHAMREVIRQCIYGVDKNPLAVELCKVAFWLESFNPGEPLGFLDHHVKCGDAIVGLAHREELENGIADEAFKTLPGDDKEIAQLFAKKNRNERKERDNQLKAQQLKTSFESTITNEVNEAMAEYKTFNQMPETTPEEIELKTRAYRRFIGGKGYNFLKAMADTQLAQFFIRKTTENKDMLLTDADFRLMLSGYKGWQDRKVAKASVVSMQNRFFHWFLEFPEVFNEGGFDCILGNPPYLGGTKISTNYGLVYSHALLSLFQNTSGLADLVSFFIKKNVSLIKKNGFFSILTTDSVSQGATRLSALDELQFNGTIIFGIKSIVWPGEAAVNVSLISFYKGKWLKEIFLNKRSVEFINSLLGEESENNTTFELIQNKNKTYTGSKIYGEGFVLDQDTAISLIHNPNNQLIIKQYLTGDDIANDLEGLPSRFVINFQEWPLERYNKIEWISLPDNIKNEINERISNNKLIVKAPSWYGDYCARDFPFAINIIEQKVKAERLKVKGDLNAQKYWWIYQRVRREMYNAISSYKNVIVLAQTAKYITPTYTINNKVFSVKVIVFTDQSYRHFSLISNSLYNEWVWKYGTTMGSSTLQFSTSQCFDNYPFPPQKYDLYKWNLEVIGENFYTVRKQLMHALQLGLTRTYNAFHAKEVNTGIRVGSLKVEDRATIQKHFGKEVCNLWTHLQKTAGTCTFEEAVACIVKLRELHVEMDQAVLEAYGWQDVKLRHDFYEVDYLPENDRVRFTIHPEARKEILKRLLELNHKIYEEEVVAGLHKKADVEKFYAQKGRPVPLNLVYSDMKPNKKKIKKENIQNQAVQKNLFDDVNNAIMKEFSLHEGIYSIGDTAGILNQPYNKIRRWFLKLSEANYEGLSDSVKTDIDNRRISFHGLVELVIIGELLETGVKARKIFKAREDLSSIINKPYPFATSDVKDKLKISGSDIIFDFEEGLVTLDGSRQFNFEFIREFFAEIEFKSGIAIRLLPAKGLKRIQINPKAAGGRPAFVSQKDVKVETILRFYKGPDSVKEIIEDFGISEEDIKAALAYQS